MAGTPGLCKILSRSRAWKLWLRNHSVLCLGLSRRLGSSGTGLGRGDIFGGREDSDLFCGLGAAGAWLLVVLYVSPLESCSTSGILDILLAFRDDFIKPTVRSVCLYRGPQAYNFRLQQAYDSENSGFLGFP